MNSIPPSEIPTLLQFIQTSVTSFSLQYQLCPSYKKDLFLVFDIEVIKHHQSMQHNLF